MLFRFHAKLRPGVDIREITVDFERPTWPKAESCSDIILDQLGLHKTDLVPGWMITLAPVVESRGFELRGDSQVLSVIVLDCIQRCNDLELARADYVLMLDATLRDRGIKNMSAEGILKILEVE